METEMTKKNQTVGERLYELRTRNNMTQEKLAEELNVSRQSISKWELDKTLPDVERLMQLSDLYQVSMDYLIKGTKENSDEIVKTKESLKNTSENTSIMDIRNSLGDVSEDVLGNGSEYVSEDITGNGLENGVEHISEKTSEQEEKIFHIYRYTICLICTIISGVLCVCVLSFAAKLFSNKVSDIKNMNQQPVCVEKIYHQYTNADVVGFTMDGKIYRDTVWLDIADVAEGDYISCYNDGKSDELTFEYYTKTLVLPLIFGIVFLIFFIVFLMECRSIKMKSEKKGK